MTNKVDKIRDTDDLLFEEFQEYFSKIANSCFAKTFPQTCNLSLFFDTSINFIKTGIYENVDADNLFAVKILFRTLIEHYLRYHLIWFKWCACKNDEYSKHYIMYSEAKEVIDTIKAEINANNLNSNWDTVEQWRKVLKTYPKLNGLSEADIKTECNKFSIKNIIRFINVELGEKFKTSMLQSILVEYSKLSSYAHGGIASHYDFLRYSEEDIRIVEMERIVALSTQIAASVKLFTLIMLIQTDKDEFVKHYYRIDYLIKQI